MKPGDTVRVHTPAYTDHGRIGEIVGRALAGRRWNDELNKKWRVHLDGDGPDMFFGYNEDELRKVTQKEG